MASILKGFGIAFCMALVAILVLGLVESMFGRVSPQLDLLRQMVFIVFLSGIIGFAMKCGRRAATLITLLGVSVATIIYVESVRMYPVILGLDSGVVYVRTLWSEIEYCLSMLAYVGPLSVLGGFIGSSLRGKKGRTQKN